MVEINREDYKKMKQAMKTKKFSVLKDLNLAVGVSELALRRVLKENAYAGVSLEETFGAFKIVDGPTDFITKEEIDLLLNRHVTINGNQRFILKNELAIAISFLNGIGHTPKDYGRAMESIMKMPYYFVLVSGRRMKEFTIDLEKELSGFTEMPPEDFFDELLKKIFGDYTLV